MNGSIKTDRRYTLGEYKYTTMEDIIEDIPKELYLNTTFTSTVRFLQLLSFEIAYRKYVELVSKYPHTMDLSKAIEQLEELRDKELTALKVIINGDLEEPTTEE